MDLTRFYNLQSHASVLKYAQIHLCTSADYNFYVEFSVSATFSLTGVTLQNPEHRRLDAKLGNITTDGRNGIVLGGAEGPSAEFVFYAWRQLDGNE